MRLVSLFGMTEMFEKRLHNAHDSTVCSVPRGGAF